MTVSVAFDKRLPIFAETDSTADFIRWVFAAAVVVVVVRVLLQRQRRVLLFKEAHEWAATVQQSHAFPIVAVDIILKPGEAAFYSTPSDLYETRAVGHYQAGHVGVRVAKGVWVGGTSGRSVSAQKWTRLDAGTLIITNKRLVFNGSTEDRSVPLSKIIAVHNSISDIQVAVEGRERAMAFSAANPMIASVIINLCCQVSDPLNLSSDNINFQFQE